MNLVFCFVFCFFPFKIIDPNRLVITIEHFIYLYEQAVFLTQQNVADGPSWPRCGAHIRASHTFYSPILTEII